MAPYRALRILFSWTAYALGLGRPAWILEAYALQNVVCWLLLAVLLTRWIPLTTGRGLVLWAACLFAPRDDVVGQVGLLDVPTGADRARCSCRRERTTAALRGNYRLLRARPSNLLALTSQPIPHDWRAWARLSLAVILAVVPLLVWLDYLRSIYRSTLFAHTDQLMLGTGLYAGCRKVIFRDLENGGW